MDEQEEVEWNDGHILEGLDRCHTLLVLIDQLLNEHPAIIKAGMEENLSKAEEMIVDIYQEIGRLDFEIMPD